jgi:lysophospholipase L1-like esterase
MIARRVASNVALAAAALLVALAGAELACRLLVGVGWLRPSLRGRVAPELGYAARLVRSADPRLYVENDPAGPLVNRDGFRGPDLPHEKAPGTFRIVVLGDSVTFGLGVPTEATFPARLGAALAAESGARGPRYDVLNLGVSGYGTAQEIRLLEAKGLAYEPDLVVLAYVVNDPLGPELLALSLREAAEIERRPLHVAARHSELLGLVLDRVGLLRQIGRTEATYEKAYGHPEAWASVVDGLAELARLAGEHGFRVAVVMFPLLYDFERYPLARYDEQVREAVARAGFPFLDLRAVLPARDGTAYRLNVLDDTHPNARGHADAAVAIERFLRESGSLAPPAPSAR